MYLLGNPIVVWLSGIAVLTAGILLLIFLRYRDSVPKAVQARAATFAAPAPGSQPQVPPATGVRGRGRGR